MSTKKQITLTIDDEVKKLFHLECIGNGVTMSETIESMMGQYVNISQELKGKKNEN